MRLSEMAIAQVYPPAIHRAAFQPFDGSRKGRSLPILLIIASSSTHRRKSSVADPHHPGSPLKQARYHRHGATTKPETRWPGSICSCNGCRCHRDSPPRAGYPCRWRPNAPEIRLMWTLLFSADGRINRAKFWGVNAIASVASVLWSRLCAYVATILWPMLPREYWPGSEREAFWTLFLVLSILNLPFLWVALAIASKRWHDRDKSAAWILISLVPVIGWGWHLVECGFLRGTVGPNKYGPDPMDGAAELDRARSIEVGTVWLPLSASPRAGLQIGAPLQMFCRARQRSRGRSLTSMRC